jgi:rhamnosyl/mannosyltransferase
VLTYHAGVLRSGSPLLAAPAAAHRATLERAMIASAGGRIAVSAFVARSVFAGRSHALAPPGVDARRFAPGGSPVPGRVLFVGPASRAYAWKGLSVLAAAVARMPGARLRVVGEGDLADRYRARGVDVVGRVDEDRLVEEYRSSSVVALPSTSPAESFGMALAEANACGRPVVGSRVGGIPCFVRDGFNGLLVEPGDPDALAASLRRVLEDGPLAARLGANGRALVEKEHRWEDVARRCLDAFTAACAPASRRSAS